MILEGIVSTVDSQGKANLAPMGPLTPDDDPAAWNSFILRPFKTSRTYANLHRRPEGVLHVTDGVLLFAQATVGGATAPVVPAAAVGGVRLVDCCRYYEFRIEEWDERQDRTALTATVVASGRVRDFFGFNRAKHAVLEAAILATRGFLISREELEAQLAPLRSAVERTAGPDEAEAFRLIEEHIRRYFAAQGSGGAAAD